MNSSRVYLPGSKAPKDAMPFAIGARVILKCCPADNTGTVVGMRRGKVIVEWTSLDYVGRHRPEALILAADAKEK